MRNFRQFCQFFTPRSSNKRSAMFPFLLLDAFTTQPLNGNPCAVELSPATRQRLAREFNQSETAFVNQFAPGSTEFTVRFFTPAEEIPLAGHPTIATVTALLHAGRVVLPASAAALTLTLHLLHGPIRVDVMPPTGSEPPLVWMTQRQPVFGAIHAPEDVLPLFGLVPDDLLPGAPIQTVSTGTPQLMLLLRDHSALRRAHVADAAALGRYRAGSDFFSPHLFCLGGATPAGHKGQHPPFRHSARCVGRPRYGLGYRRYGGLPLALRLYRFAQFSSRART